MDVSDGANVPTAFSGCMKARIASSGMQLSDVLKGQQKGLNERFPCSVIFFSKGS